MTLDDSKRKFEHLLEQADAARRNRDFDKATEYLKDAQRAIDDMKKQSEEKDR
jgi:hypothetical protein